jgi:hypothetical protein
MARIPIHKSSGNVFADIGFPPAEAVELTAKSTLISAIAEPSNGAISRKSKRHGFAILIRLPFPRFCADAWRA